MSRNTLYMTTALSLLIWVFFYLRSQPLEAEETTVVVAFSAVLVLSGKWVVRFLFGMMRKNEDKS